MGPLVFKCGEQNRVNLQSMNTPGRDQTFALHFVAVCVVAVKLESLRIIFLVLLDLTLFGAHL